jgi:membrane protein implicated in regulation of membrane protease activity
MMVEEVALAPAPAVDWSQPEREAREAAVAVALFVGTPAVVAAATALLVFALTWFVLFAPLVAAVLTWMAWRYGRARPRRPGPV